METCFSIGKRKLGIGAGGETGVRTWFRPMFLEVRILSRVPNKGRVYSGESSSVLKTVLW